jgi:uncharacterized protein
MEGTTMFVCVARVTLDVPAASNLKAKRQVLRRVTDRVKAKFNVAVAEVEDAEMGHRAMIALSVLSGEHRHVKEMMEKILHYIDEMYIAPISSREVEILSLGDDVFRGARMSGEEEFARLMMPKADRSMAEAEGLGAWENRRRIPHAMPSAPRRPNPSAPRLSGEDAKAVARSLRNRRDWEKP